MDEIEEAFDAEVGERLDALFVNAYDPDGPALGLHFVCDVSQLIFVFAEVPRDLGEGGDVMAEIDTAPSAPAGPDDLATVQALGLERHAQAIVSRPRELHPEPLSDRT